MKKIIVTIVAILVLMGTFTGCESHDVKKTTTTTYSATTTWARDEYEVDGETMTVEEFENWCEDHPMYKAGR